MYNCIDQLFTIVKSQPLADKITNPSDDTPIIKDVSIPEYDIDEGANKDGELPKITDDILRYEFDVEKDCKFKGKLKNEKP